MITFYLVAGFYLAIWSNWDPIGCLSMEYLETENLEKEQVENGIVRIDIKVS